MEQEFKWDSSDDMDFVSCCINKKDPILKNLHEIALTRESEYIERLINDFNPLCEMCLHAQSLWDKGTITTGVFCIVCIRLAMRASAPPPLPKLEFSN